MNRRQFLAFGAAATGTVALASIGRSRRSLAVAETEAIPTVDRLVMTNVVDNVYDIFARAGRRGTITVERTPLAMTAGLPLLAEHGLALHLESVRGSERREILLDFSLTDQNLSHNYRALRVEPAKADALILSHGHGDHYGGLPALAATGRLRRALTLYAGGEDTFCHRVVTSPAGPIDYGQLDQASLEAHGLRVVLAKEPTVVAGHAVTSGQIPRLTDFEKPPAAARLVAGPMDSACAASLHFPPGTLKVEATPGELVVDTFRGEIATAYAVRGRGLVVITSCGHAGVINSIRQLQKATGIEKVHAVVGGFHLAPAPDEIVEKTLAALRAIDPDYIVPMHCTGLNTIIAIHREMPETLVAPSTGTRIIFGA